MGRWSEKAPSERGHLSWWRPIDYDKEIAQDEKNIADMSNPLTALVSRELLPAALKAYPESTVESWSLYHILAYPVVGRRERLERFGLSMDDLRAWANVLDDREFGEELPHNRASFKRGDELARQWEWFQVMSEPTRLKVLRGAKASLARHKRNKEKFGY